MITHPTYNLIKFGAYLKLFRQKGKLTQKDVAIKTSINIETIRNIEKARQVPSLLTLEKLNDLYKVDIHQLLESCKLCNDYNFIYQENMLSRFQVERDFDAMKKQHQELQKYIESTDCSSHAWIKLSQLSYLNEFVQILSKSDALNTSIKYDLCINALKLGHPTFSIAKFDDHTYSIMELRFLVLLTVPLSSMKKYDISLDILNYAIEKLTALASSERLAQRHLTLAYLYLAQTYTDQDDDETCIAILDKGMSIAQGFNRYDIYDNLYSRRAFAKCRLNHDDGKTAIIESLFLRKLLKKDHLFDLALPIVKKKYYPDIENYFKELL